MKYKAIIFDFFGVIASDMYILWLKKNGLGDQVQSLIQSHFQYSDVGTLSAEDLHSYLASLVGRSTNAVESELKEYLQLDPNVAQYIKSFWNNPLQIAICSNAPKNIVESFLNEKGIQRYFNHVIISSALGMRKPNKDIFEKTLQMLGLKPWETVFVDDKEENIQAAEELGLKGILFESILDLSEKLHQE